MPARIKTNGRWNAICFTRNPLPFLPQCGRHGLCVLSEPASYGEPGWAFDRINHADPPVFKCHGFLSESQLSKGILPLGKESVTVVLKVVLAKVPYRLLNSAIRQIRAACKIGDFPGFDAVL